MYVCMYVCVYACVRVCVLFNAVIQQQTASQGKPTRHPVFYMLIRTHEAQCKPLFKKTKRKLQFFTRN